MTAPTDFEEELLRDFRNLYDGIVAGEYGGERELATKLMFNIASSYSNQRVRQATDKDIKKMVDKFLMWKIPADFAPDGGIRYFNTNMLHPLTGTNLLTATQAEQMIRYITSLDEQEKDHE